MVYCQSCDHLETWSLAGAEPIPAAKISVVCKDHKNQVSYYKAFETNTHGYFYAQLQGFKMSHSLLDHPLQSCHVKLVSSPLANCNLLSNVNYGLNGSPLRYEDKRLYGKSFEAIQFVLNSVVRIVVGARLEALVCFFVFLTTWVCPDDGEASAAFPTADCIGDDDNPVKFGKSM
ncbi:unnamed protein product [Ilex paraguariensis]|uniref:Pollen Ole e 1 allergen and extensin family protein n=1 Tax=Ilex paraguariensis TaxID=185542 RepID=A0ABC8QT95_9AQUA